MEVSKRSEGMGKSIDSTEHFYKITNLIERHNCLL